MHLHYYCKAIRIYPVFSFNILHTNYLSQKRLLINQYQSSFRSNKISMESYQLYLVWCSFKTVYSLMPIVTTYSVIGLFFRFFSFSFCCFSFSGINNNLTTVISKVQIEHGHYTQCLRNQRRELSTINVSAIQTYYALPPSKFLWTRETYVGNFSRIQRGGNILQNLAEVQLFMDIIWPNNIIIDDEAMHTYKKINRFLVQLKFTQVHYCLKESCSKARRHHNFLYKNRKIL